ncbi:MAG: pyrroloquinoline quinone-dependent dehydrogenase [Gemmatimonadaceae bacterium]|nr:pyrroloquinoline quinone-dependent dehydrogenase [Gemmatimonadaceae bacterium]
MTGSRWRPAFNLALAVGVTATSPAFAQAPVNSEWPVYGGDAGGQRYSPLAQINRRTVSDLVPAWTFRSGELSERVERGSPPSLEVTPLMVDGSVFVSTPLGRVFALDPATGAERWRFDAKVPANAGYGDFTNRGVAWWRDAQADARGDSSAVCARRVLAVSIDARLFALDARTGLPCAAFGRAGVVNLREGLRLPPFEFPAYQQTSPPTVVGDVVVLGSSIADNSRINPASGEVRAFDVRTGRLLWSFDPIPQDARDPQFASWQGRANATGGANVWSVIVADSALGLVYLPTSSPAPDYVGILRPGDNRYANSVVALRVRDGQVAWHFQTVHHDLWDYDNASPPALTTVRVGGVMREAVVQGTKTGQLFVLDRRTGEPLLPVEERAVPRSDVPGEQASATQPFSVITLSPHHFALDSVWGPTAEDRDACREAIAPLRNEGIFTPPSLQGTLAIPSNIGGAHWGGVAIDPETRTAFVPVNRLLAMVQLIPDSLYDPAAARAISSRTDDQFTRMRGTGYVMRRRILLGPSGLPCSPPPFGELVAVNLDSGQRRWSVPLGRMQRDSSAATPDDWGSPNLGGPLVTAGGLVFMGGSIDRSLRAFDSATGQVLWRGTLPAGGKATPMTYAYRGRQYVLIAAGGGGVWGSGDAIVAFALPETR